MAKKQLDNIINIIGNFKNLKRRGWINRQVAHPESDADHSFSTALLVMLLAPQNLDKLKCLELALIHDLAEVYAGDITPEDSIAPVDKYAAEKQSIRQIATELNFAQLPELFNEYEAKTTPEAIFVNALDKLDTAMTAAFYDRTYRAPQKLLPEFLSHAQKRIEKLIPNREGQIKQFLELLQYEGKTNE